MKHDWIINGWLGGSSTDESQETCFVVATDQQLRLDLNGATFFATLGRIIKWQMLKHGWWDVMGEKVKTSNNSRGTWKSTGHLVKLGQLGTRDRHIKKGGDLDGM